MAGSVNKVIIVGNVVADPETRTFANGGRVCNLRVATNETWRDKASGERKERAEFHSVAIFSEPLAKVAEQYLRKGSKVYIEGQLETRKWQDQEGNDRYSTEVVLRPFRSELTMLDGAQGGGDRQEGGRGFANSAHQTAYDGLAPAGGFGGGNALDEDSIPFLHEWRG